MQPNKLCYLFLPLFLSACGGSDDNSASPVVEEAPTPQYITASFVKTINKCGDEQPDLIYDIFVHNSDGTVKSEHKPEANGSLSIEWQAGLHLSFVYKHSDGLNINSYVDIPAGDLGKFKNSNASVFVTDEQCTCRDVKIDFTDVKATYSNYEITVGQFNRQIFKPVYSYEICKTPEQLVEPLFVRLQSQSLDLAVATIISSEQLANDEVLVQPNWFESDISKAAPLAATGIDFDGARNSMRVFANTDYGRQHYYYSSEGTSLYSFDGLFDDNFLQIYNTKNVSNETGDAFYVAIQRQKITDVNLVYNFGFTDNFEVLMSEAEHLLTGFGGDANQVDYDFSDEIQNHIVLWTSFSDFTNNYTINVLAPIKGTMPNLRLNEFYEAMLDEMQPDDFDLEKFGYEGLTSYSDYLSERAKWSRLNNFKMPAVFNHYNTDFLIISLNNTIKQAATATSDIKILNQHRIFNREAMSLQK